jgi:hypothetical protein
MVSLVYPSSFNILVSLLPWELLRINATRLSGTLSNKTTLLILVTSQFRAQGFVQLADTNASPYSGGSID